MMVRPWRSYSPAGEPSGDLDALARLARAVGVDPEPVMTGDAYADAVLADVELASRIGIRGVPYFVLDRRFGVSGAQPAELLLQALEKTWEARTPAA